VRRSEARGQRPEGEKVRRSEARTTEDGTSESRGKGGKAIGSAGLKPWPTCLFFELTM
jgi:hypothetical protein